MKANIFYKVKEGFDRCQKDFKGAYIKPSIINSHYMCDRMKEMSTNILSNEMKERPLFTLFCEIIFGR